MIQTYSHVPNTLANIRWLGQNCHWTEIVARLKWLIDRKKYLLVNMLLESYPYPDEQWECYFPILSVVIQENVPATLLLLPHFPGWQGDRMAYDLWEMAYNGNSEFHEEIEEMMRTRPNVWTYLSLDTCPNLDPIDLITLCDQAVIQHIFHLYIQNHYMSPLNYLERAETVLEAFPHFMDTAHQQLPYLGDYTDPEFTLSPVKEIEYFNFFRKHGSFDDLGQIAKTRGHIILYLLLQIDG